MTKEICAFPSKRFYEDKLRPAKQLMTEKPWPLRPYVVLMVKGKEQKSVDGYELIIIVRKEREISKSYFPIWSLVIVIFCFIYSVNKKNWLIDYNDNENNNDNRIVFLPNENALQKTILTALSL